MTHHTPGYFEIDSVGSDITAEDFERDYLRPERPVIIEGAGAAWPALGRWDLPYLRQRLAAEPSVRNLALFLTLDGDVMAEDFSYPPFVAGLRTSPDIFPYPTNARIWINSRDNVSAWHFDNGVVNNFNTQITGSKEWTLVSPQTPLPCYPFSNFVVLDDDARLLRNTIHTRFVTRPGDMLYLPPLWFHTVRALEERNINLMWVFTKRRAPVNSPALARDEMRYRLDWHLSRHRWTAVRKAYAALTARSPRFLRVVWHFDRLIETDIAWTRRRQLRWFVDELKMLGRTVLTAPRIRAALRRSEKAPRLGATPRGEETAGY